MAQTIHTGDELAFCAISAFAAPTELKPDADKAAALISRRGLRVEIR